MFLRKEATAENTDQAAHVHWIQPGQKLNYLPQNDFDKDSMTKRHMNIHADQSVSTVWESA